MNIFEEATKLKLRFSSTSGLLSVEDLWDLPLTGTKVNLDDIAKSVYTVIKAETISFVSETVSGNKANELRLAILKHIIAVRLEEREIAKNARERSRTKQLVLDAIAKREETDLLSKPLEELRKIAAEL